MKKREKQQSEEQDDDDTEWLSSEDDGDDGDQPRPHELQGMYLNTCLYVFIECLYVCMLISVNRKLSINYI